MNILEFFALILDEASCAQIFRMARWNGLVSCPHCNCDSIKRYGKYRVCFQRYFCHNCKKTFNDKIGTIFGYSHVSLSRWFCYIWMFCICSITGMSIREISKKLAVQYRTSYYMSRKIMQKISESQKEMTLFGNCEADELYVHCGMKGRNYHDIIVSSGRLPRRHAVKPPPGRGRFEGNFPMVMCYHQRGGNTIFAVPQNYDSIASLVCSTIIKGSRINTDKYRAYNSLESLGYDHRAVNYGLKEYARGDIHTNNCECRTALLRLWMAKHRGVNKFNLELYLKTFQFIHNIRHLDDYSRFLRILSVVYIATRFYIKSDSFNRSAIPFGTDTFQTNR